MARLLSGGAFQGFRSFKGLGFRVQGLRLEGVFGLLRGFFRGVEVLGAGPGDIDFTLHLVLQLASWEGRPNPR